MVDANHPRRYSIHLKSITRGGMAIKLISILFPILLLVGLLVACNTEEDGEEMINKQVEEEVSGDGNGGFLWKVEHGDTVVYLHGTIHVGKEKFYPLNPQTEEAYEKSDIILPEVDLNNTDLSGSKRINQGICCLYGRNNN